MKRNKQYYARKLHRFLGVFLGIQFLLWTLGGLYFSWTDIDEIHGDHFVIEPEPLAFNSDSLSISDIHESNINSISMVSVLSEPYFWVNESKLYHAATGKLRDEISESEAIAIANARLIGDIPFKKATYINEVGKHHEYRNRPLPAWKIDFDTTEDITVYIDARNGSFQRIRHQQWRWFDFLWMLHTMDYEGRDDMNNAILRGFSILGLITVGSGFALFFMTIRRRKATISPRN